MMLRETELVKLTEIVWGTLVGTPIESVEQDSPEGNPGSLVAQVKVSGEWSGLVRLVCSERMTESLASVLFGIMPEDVIRADSKDALGELANIIAGYVKAMSDRICDLSLPTVVSGDGDPELIESDLRVDASFLCDGEACRISVYSPAPVTRV